METPNEIQQIFDQKLSNVISQQLIHILRLESQIIVMEKKIAELEKSKETNNQ